MSRTFISSDPAGLYIDLRDALLEHGREVHPRGQRTLELPAVTAVLLDPSSPAPTGVGRKLVPSIGAAEATNLIGGFSDANLLINCAKNFSMFVEGPSGDRLMGAYGPRVHRQWEGVIQQLTSDRDSRQAGVNVWYPDELRYRVPSKDVPCTLSLYYQIRDDKLEAFTTMRSNDLVWGTPYDWMQFTAAQRALAYALGVEPGPYHHHAYSLHAYVDRDDISTWEYGQEHEFSQPTDYPYLEPFEGDETSMDRWNWIRDDLIGLSTVEDMGTYSPPGAHGWYRDLLDGKQSGGRLCWGCRYVLPEEDKHWPSCYFSSGAVDLCQVCATEF